MISEEDRAVQTTPQPWITDTNLSKYANNLLPYNRISNLKAKRHQSEVEIAAHVLCSSWISDLSVNQILEVDECAYFELSVLVLFYEQVIHIVCTISYCLF